jgi:hypothetical protein
MARIGWSEFIIWQCSLRQRNFRMFGGKPSEGTIAIAADNKNNNDLASFRSILIEKECLNTSKMFEFIHKQTHDPETRFDKAIKFFSSEYYNTPKNFDGSFTATFKNNSNIAKNLLKLKNINVQFFERETGFNFTVKVTKLKKANDKWKYTFYHNAFFNVNLTEDIEILNFSPDKVGIKKIT